MRINWNDKENIERLVKESISYSDVLRKLDLNPASSTKTLQRYVVLYGLDVSHFNPYANRPQGRPLNEILVENSSHVDRTHLKKRLVKEGILKYECSGCMNDGTWLGRSITLQLDHLNGIQSDNRVENLRFLCPNCHSQTETYAGRNKQRDSLEA